MIKIIYNTLCSIAFLQEANVLHRDIKPGNLLIDQNYDVKICDFGMARSLPKANQIQKDIKSYKKSQYKLV